MPKERTIRYNFLMNLILTVTQMLYPLVTFTYAARILGVDGIGEVSFAFSTIAYFTRLAAVGLPTYGIRIFAQKKDDYIELSKTYQELMLISLACTALSYIIFFVGLYTVPRFQASSKLLLIASLNIILTVLGTQWFYQGIEEYGHITRSGLIVRAAALVILFVFVKTKQDTDVYLWTYLLSETGFSIFNMLSIRKYVTFRRVGTLNFRQHIRPLLLFFAMAVSTTIYTNLDTVMLGFLKDSTEVGYYNGALKISRVLTTVSTVFGVVLMPRISSLVKQSKDEEASLLLQESMEFILVAAIPLMVFSFFFATPICVFICGADFSYSGTVLRVLIPSILFAALSNVFGYQILAPYEQESKVTIAVSVGAVVDGVLNALMIPRYGAFGAALATSLAELVVLLLEGYYIRGRLSALFARFTPRLILAGIGFPILLAYGLTFLPLQEGFIKLFICGIIYVVLYALLLLVIKEPLLYGMVQGLLKKIHLSR